MPATTIIFNCVTGTKGDAGVTVTAYVPAESPEILNCPRLFTLLEYTTFVDEVAVTVAIVPTGVMLPLIFPDVAVTTVLKTGFNL